jgi:hypothetical protein
MLTRKGLWIPTTPTSDTGFAEPAGVGAAASDLEFLAQK